MKNAEYEYIAFVKKKEHWILFFLQYTAPTSGNDNLSNWQRKAC